MNKRNQKAKAPKVARAKIGSDPAPKRPRYLARDTDGRVQHPLFCFGTVDRNSDGDFGWSFAGNHAETLLHFIREMSELDWNQVRQLTAAGHRRYHSMPISKLGRDAQARLETLQLDQLDENIYRFRVDSGARLWGFEIDGAFLAVWWDPEHRVYPTERH